jgi:hypothetical protein
VISAVQLPIHDRDGGKETKKGRERLRLRGCIEATQLFPMDRDGIDESREEAAVNMSGRKG